MNKWCIQTSNLPINGAPDLSDLNDMLSCGCSSALIMQDQAPYLPRLRQALDGNIYARWYVTSTLERDPVQLANEFAVWLLAHPEVTDAIFCNEINLGEEGGEHSSDPVYCAKWQAIVASNLKRLCPHVRVHSGAYSPSGNWLPYYQALVEYESAFDVIDVHCYSDLATMQAIVNAVLALTTKPIFCSEINGSGTIDFFHWAETIAQIIGISYFIWFWSGNAKWPGNLKTSPLRAQIKGATKMEFPPPIDPFAPNPDGSSGRVDASGNYYEGVSEEDMQAITGLQNQVKQLLDQNALLTAAIKAYRTGNFDGSSGDGANSVDGLYMALRGGAAIDYVPSYPPKA